MQLFFFAFFILLSCAIAEPFIHSAVRKQLAQDGQVSLFVTFRTADVSAANDPERLAKALAHENPQQFVVETEAYHLARGQYVYDALARMHTRTRDHLLLALRTGHLDEQLSLPISNSFVIHEAGSDTLEALLAMEDLEEVVTTSGHRVQLPKPNSSLQPKSFNSVFEEEEELIVEAVENDGSNNNNNGRGIEWNIKKIGAPEVWQLGPKGKGSGIVYGIADTGTAFKHPRLAQNYMGLRGKDAQGNANYDHNYAWYDGVRTPLGSRGAIAPFSRSSCPVAGLEPCDDQGHGTHVASTAVGSDGMGVAPGAKWIACRNMDAGLGAPQAYLACLNFFLAPHDLNGKNPRPELRPHVVGNSYGCPDSEGCSPRALKSAVEALRAAGVFMSVSAGNEGPQCGTVASPPAIEPAVISVGATDRDDGLARFSSRGPVMIGGVSWAKPDISAPGVQIRAAFPPDQERVLSGTSMAAPHVGGAAALIMAMCPCIQRDVDKIQVILQATAEHLLPPPSDSFCGKDNAQSIPNNYFGYGRINVKEAVRTCQKLCLVKNLNQQ